MDSLEALVLLDRILGCRVQRFGRSEDQFLNPVWITVVPDVVANSKVLDSIDPIGPILSGIEHSEVMVIDRHLEVIW